MENCKPGITAYGSNIPQKTIEEAYFENRQGYSSSDTYMQGSFCPKISGIYNITFEGTVCVWDSYFTFVTDTHMNQPNSIIKHLYKNMCYSYYIQSHCITYSYSKITIKIPNHERYVLNSSESITCSYTGCVNGMLESNHCLPISTYTCQNELHFNLFNKYVSIFIFIY